MKKKSLLCILLAAALLILSACSASKSGQTQERSEGFVPLRDTQTESEITIAGHYNNFEALEEEFNRFLAYYPNVKLTYNFMDGYSKSGSGILSTALKSSEAPDIFFTYPYMKIWEDGAEIFAAAENLADPALGIDLSCIRPGLITKEEDGSVYSVPVYTTTYGMLVNEDLFAKENLSVPTTYEELIQACEKLKNAGYSSPVMCYSQGDMLYSMVYPYFCGQIKDNEAALKAMNSMEPGAGEYVRKTLELAADFMSRGFMDLEQCGALEDNYESVILRFFEGDVPIMLATGNTVSGTEKREAKSEAFSANPFKYTFYPVPSTDQGGYFTNSVSIGFGVNKNSSHLDMANEFMRFLVSTEELNLICKAKRMVTPCVDMSLDSVYAPFQEISSDRFINLSELGLDDEPASQVNKAIRKVSVGEMSVDEAVAAFGTLE